MVFDGLEELKRQLQHLPETLAAEAGHIVEAAANAAAAEIKAGYHVGPPHRLPVRRNKQIVGYKPYQGGHLRDGVYVSHEVNGKVSAGAVVKSSAPHAWMYEHGTVDRAYTTRKGHDHKTGSMWGTSQVPHTFVKAAMKWRRRMYQQLSELLQRHGFEVTGKAA